MTGVRDSAVRMRLASDQPHAAPLRVSTAAPDTAPYATQRSAHSAPTAASWAWPQS